jgi:hypothetical protein
MAYLDAHLYESIGFSNLLLIKWFSRWNMTKSHQNLLPTQTVIAAHIIYSF